MPRSPFSRARGQGDDLLDRQPLFAGLDPELRQRVYKRLNRRRVGAGKTLFRQGDPADALHLIESGRFRVFIGEGANDEHVLGFLGPGELLGEAAFLAETPQALTAEALENSSVWTLPRADFDALLGGLEGPLRYLASLIGKRQVRANARLAVESAPEDARDLRGFVTAVYSPRGGAGVTTLAVNLAVALAERHPDRTVLLDLDVMFGHALANLWLEPRGVLAQVSPVTLRSLDRTGLDHYLLPHSSSLRVFPGATGPEQGRGLTGDHVRAAVAALQRSFSHIVLDLPHPFNDVTLAGLDVASRVLLVGTPEKAVVQDVRETQRIFGEVLHLPPERIGFVLNHALPYMSVAVGELGAAFGGAAWSEVPYGGDAPSMAALRGEALLSSRPTNPVSRAAGQLADKLTQAAAEAAALNGRPPI